MSNSSLIDDWCFPCLVHTNQPDYNELTVWYNIYYISKSIPVLTMFQYNYIKYPTATELNIYKYLGEII